ncbi:MAG TPA: right-handed parallel beta-helix repeat-containing protein [Verrucomicrobiae bacterium]
MENIRQAVGLFQQALNKSLLFACFLAFPAAGVAASEMPAIKPLVVTLQSGVTCAEIQKALDDLPASGGEVMLPAEKIEINNPIVLRRDYETLSGAGASTILFLADNANCPVIIMGEPVNDPKQTVKHLRVGGLFIDGNRLHQQRELWRLQGEGSEIRNNGITVQDVSDSTIEQVTCAHCRSGGLVTTLGVRRLTVRDLTAFGNQFDGLACYLTQDSTFAKLFLHDNPGAGISLDLDFNHNVIEDASLDANDLGIFMRDSCDNQFHNISVRDSHDYGVFMAQAVERTAGGWQPTSQTRCTNNSFTGFMADKCGSAAFRINDTACTNNVLVGAQFIGDTHGELSLVQPNLLTVRQSPSLAGN